MEVWFNPSCSRCRTPRDEHTLRRSLDELPTEAEIRAAPAAHNLADVVVTGRRTGDGA